MKRSEAVQAWGRVLAGRLPAMSIEITKECPLRCPGCYAYEDQHLGGPVTLRQLVDRKGSALVEGVLALVDRHRPLHVSIVGGDPLVRFRELEELLPLLDQRGVFVQVVTSAFRPIPLAWAQLSRLNICVSIDGLQPEHDERRKPATYDRILKNIAGHRVIVHCTITGQMMKRADYLEEFMQFWTPRPEVQKIWMSMFTPQRGQELPECLTPAVRRQAIDDLLRLRRLYPKLGMGGRPFASSRARPPRPPTASSRKPPRPSPPTSRPASRPASSAAIPTAPTAAASPQPGWRRSAATSCAAVFPSGRSSTPRRSEERRVGKECRSRWSPYH